FCRATAPCYTPTRSLHDALPISRGAPQVVARTMLRLQAEHRQLLKIRTFAEHLARLGPGRVEQNEQRPTPRLQALDIAHHPLRRDRKSTRLNSSHVKISYAVFCL